MSNFKYDWPTYLPRMIDLYKTGMPIPKIHRLIQDPENGFTPKSRMVYQKFNSEGYPTDQAKRTKLLSSLNIVRWPSESMMDAPYSNQSVLEDYPPTACHVVPLVWSQPLEKQPIPDHAPRNLIPPLDYAHHDRSNLTSAQDQYMGDVDLCYDLFVDVDTQTSEAAGSIDKNIFDDSSWYNKDEIDSDQPSLASVASQPGDSSLDSKANIQCTSETLPNMSKDVVGSGLDSDSSPFSMFPDRSIEVKADDFHSAMPMEELDAPNSPNSPTPLSLSKPYSLPYGRALSKPGVTFNLVNGFRSWMKPSIRYNRSCTPERRTSTSSDSGYASGRNSPLIPAVDGDYPHPRSLDEFKGLYRVPCQFLHEPPEYDAFYQPQPMHRYKDKPTCAYCLYSGIHNLSWSARHLKLEVFKTELNLQGIHGVGMIYDVAALDAVGNSALHFAAAGGAEFKHFLLLIQAGVYPYQLNTAGQLFLHCWRPDIKKLGSDSLDEGLVELFHADLINLLNSYQPQGAFGWRDNEGMTVLDAISLQLTDMELRIETFRRVKDAGYPLEVSNQFVDAFQPSVTLAHSNSDGQLPAESASCTPRVDNSFAIVRERQDRAFTILGKSSFEPTYIDLETGENILHALARLWYPEKGFIITKLQKVVVQDGVDLNLPNGEGDSPLIAFVRERPFQGVEIESGALMSKYLDVLLWRDVRHRLPNRINVNMRNKEGATALFYAAIRGRPDSVRSLIEAGANVNARLNVDGNRISILRAARNARNHAVQDPVKCHLLLNVISYLENENAVDEPTALQERGRCANSVTRMPL